MAELNLPGYTSEIYKWWTLQDSNCPEEVLAIEADALVFAHPEQCTLCAECETVCPESAVACYYQISWADKEE